MGLVVGSLITTAIHAGDLIRPLNAHPSENGALVDGLRNGDQVNDRRYVELNLGGLFNGLFPAIPIENFDQAPTSHNEILAFSRGHPPALIEDVPWTGLNDTIDVQFEDEYLITAYAWIVKEGGLTSAQNGCVATAEIWSKERQGLAYDTFEIIHAWDNPSAPDFADFGCAMANEIKTEIGYIPNAINIYYVDRVDFGVGPSTFAGVWCQGSKIIAMGRNTTGHLLAHEFGHGFALDHSNQTNDADQFDTTNVMHNSSNNREFLTEGQTFRAVFRRGSALNNVYDVREGQVTRFCGSNEFTDLCPKLYQRVWADGPMWPPN